MSQGKSERGGPPSRRRPTARAEPMRYMREVNLTITTEDLCAGVYLLPDQAERLIDDLREAIEAVRAFDEGRPPAPPVRVEVVFLPGDVESHRPSWDLGRCAEALRRMSRALADRLTEVGYKAIGDLLLAVAPDHGDES